MEYFDTYITAQSTNTMNYNHLAIHKDSRHSSIMPWHLEQVRKAIAYELSDTPFHTIVDCNAHIGADCMVFHSLFPCIPITAIEMDKEVVKILQTNVENVNRISNTPTLVPITVIQDDCIHYLTHNDVSDTVVYFDPPWGVDYKQNQKMNLYLSGLHLGDVVNFVLFNGPAMVIVKVPANFDFQEFDKRIDYEVDCKQYNIVTPSKRSYNISYTLLFIKLKRD